MGSALPRCAPHLLLSASLASAGRGGRRGCCCVVRNQSSPQRGAFPTRQHGPSSFRAASPERRQRGGEHAALHALCYLCWKQKALSSPGQRLVPEKKKLFSPLIACWCSGSRNHAPSATSSRGMNGARIRCGSRITLGGQKWLVPGLSRAVVSICLGPSSL